MKLKSIAGWNQTHSDWEFLIRSGKGGNFVALYKGKPAGTITTLTFKNKFSWISMVLVKPAFRNQGISTSMVEAAVRYARLNGTVRLDATPPGRMVYKSMGFKVERELWRMEKRGTIPDFENKCDPISASDLEELEKIDTPVFGATRKSIIRYLFNNMPEYAYCVKNNDRKITGYCLGRTGSHFEQIGPIIANCRNDAKDLLVSALGSCQDYPVIIDVFNENRYWLHLLKSLGFKIQRKYIRMYLGKLEYPGDPASQFAIAGPELG